MPCPNCNCSFINNIVMLAGFYHNGTQLYKCNNCNTNFEIKSNGIFKIIKKGTNNTLSSIVDTPSNPFEQVTIKTNPS